MVAAPPKSATQGQGHAKGIMASYPTSRTGFTALGSGFTGTANPGIGAEGFRRKSSPFDGENSYGAPSGVPSGGASFLWITLIFLPTLLILGGFAFCNRRIIV